MKFGDTLYERSVPKWAAYNFNYNEIKKLIKIRTSTGIAAPVAIPGQSNNKHAALEEELLGVLKAQYDNIGLFLRSKQGEVERRLSHLEKQVKLAQRTVNQTEGRPGAQARRVHKLLQETEEISEDIQALSRFASIQKTAFRKILKKYRKWTHSTLLQSRLEIEVFSSGQLTQDYTHLMERLSAQSTIVSGELQPIAMQRTPTSPTIRRSSFALLSETTVAEINEVASQGSLNLDAALATIPFGKSAGSAMYWIHADNLDEARVLLARHLSEINKSPASSRRGSVMSLHSQESDKSSNTSNVDDHIAYFDNIQRFVQDVSASKPSKVAVSARWNKTSKAIVTMSDMTPTASNATILRMKRRELQEAFARVDKPSTKEVSQNPTVKTIQSFLVEHRDVKPLAEVHFNRTRYNSTSPSSKVGTWANLNTDIVFSPCTSSRLGLNSSALDGGDAFPHAVLEVRWEFGRMPEIVRAFDSSYLAERVNDFSLEAAAIFSANQGLGRPSWASLLEKDIRKVPITTRTSGRYRSPRTPATGISSGASSTDGPSESIFSNYQGQSSATSDASPTDSTKDSSPLTTRKSFYQGGAKRKRARILDPQPPAPQTRYWNEFDDGDSDVNPEDTYAIYVDPNENFPGAEIVTKVFGNISNTISGARSTVVSWLPHQEKGNTQKKSSERTPLLINTIIDQDSSDSESSETTASPPLSRIGTKLYPKSPVSPRHKYRPHQQLTPRQKRLERTYFLFYTGLLALSYVFLFISAILLSTGRKKARFEVDAGVVSGITAAELCAAVSMVLACICRTNLGVLHWGVLSVSCSGVVIVGAGLLVTAFSSPTN